MGSSLPLYERVALTRATLDRFAGKPFSFGSCDCGLMVISHLKAMGWTIRTGGTWKTATALKRFLNRHGGTGASCIDSWGVPRIAPAEVIVGDIVEMRGEPPFGAFGVALGNGRVMAFHQDAPGVAVLQPVEPPLAAWRT
jgi:hypothetical protein